MTTAELPPLALRADAPAQLPPMPANTGLTWRPLNPGDVPAWHALTTVVEEHDDAMERLSKQDLVDMLRGGWRDPRRDTVGGFDDDGRLRAYAWSELRPATEGTLVSRLSGAVHPEYRRRGIGRALLAWSEARGRQQLAATESTLPARLGLYVDGHHTAAKTLAERSGFAAKRWYTDMRRDLATPLPGVVVDPSIRIEPYSRERDEDIRVTHNESFARDHWGSGTLDADMWALDVVGAEAFRPGWSFAAIDVAADQVVGYTISGAYEQDWAAQGYTEGWTDLLAVRREYRGRGIAAGLLWAAMQAFTADGIEYAGLDVDTDNPTGALGLYTRLGYVRERSSVLFTKELL